MQEMWGCNPVTKAAAGSANHVLVSAMSAVMIGLGAINQVVEYPGQLRPLKREGHIGVGSAAQSLTNFVFLGENGGNEHDRQEAGLFVFSQTRDHFESVNIGKVYIKDDRVDFSLGGDLQGGGSVLTFHDFESGFTK